MMNKDEYISGCMYMHVRVGAREHLTQVTRRSCPITSKTHDRV